MRYYTAAVSSLQNNFIGRRDGSAWQGSARLYTLLYRLYRVSPSSFPYRLNPVPYFSAPFGCLSFFAFRSCACLTAFCFWPFSLSFLPPLSPMVCLLGVANHIPAARTSGETPQLVFPTMNATRSMGRRQWREWADSRRALGAFAPTGSLCDAFDFQQHVSFGVCAYYMSPVQP